MGLLVFQLRWRRIEDAVFAANYHHIEKVLPKFVGRNCGQQTISIVYIDFDRVVWAIHIPSPTLNAVTIRHTVHAFIRWRLPWGSYASVHRLLTIRTSRQE
jgi:hypothetical protein